jgi:hypothetical protein
VGAVIELVRVTLPVALWLAPEPHAASDTVEQASTVAASTRAYPSRCRPRRVRAPARRHPSPDRRRPAVMTRGYDRAPQKSRERRQITRVNTKRTSKCVLRGG